MNRYVLVFAMWPVLALTASVAAQSKDRDNPTPLTSSVLEGGASESGHYYYRFAVGPGEVKVTGDVRVGALEVTLFDEDANKLEQISLISSDVERKIARWKFPKRTPVVMQVKLDPFRQDSTWKVRFEGAIELQGTATAATASPAPSPPAAAKSASGRQVVYRVRATGGEVLLTYRQAQGKDEQLKVVIPMDTAWEMAFDAQPGAFLYVAGQSTQTSGMVQCEIWLNGKRVFQAESSGRYVTASCSETAE